MPIFMELIGLKGEELNAEILSQGSLLPIFWRVSQRFLKNSVGEATFQGRSGGANTPGPDDSNLLAGLIGLLMPYLGSQSKIRIESFGNLNFAGMFSQASIPLQKFSPFSGGVFVAVGDVNGDSSM